MHALAVGAYFTLGFMTKFVAVLFLPLVCAVAIVWQRDGLRRVRVGRRDWAVPLLFVMAATVPWFAYQSYHAGAVLWETMFETHVVQRFTVALDKGHVQPWNYYYSSLWLELTEAGSHWIGAVGVVMLAAKAWMGQPWLARLLLLWWMLPIALISFGTSKLFWYSYPFLPPIALGAGAVAHALFHAVERRTSSGIGAAARALHRTVERRTSAVRIRALAAQLVALTPRVSREWGRPMLFAGALFALAVAVRTAIAGPLRWELDGFRLLSNSTIVRPLVISATLLGLSGYLRGRYVRTVLSRSVAISIVAILLPVFAYPQKIERAMSIRHPLRSIRDCALSVGSSHAPETHVYIPYGELLHHPYYYYLRRVGPWVQHERSSAEALRTQLTGNRLMLMTSVDYSALDAEVGAPSALVLTDIYREWITITARGRLEPCTAAPVPSGAMEVARLSRTAS